MWIRVLSDFDWKPRPAVTLAFLAGQEKNVPRACAEMAVARGLAVKMKAPTRQGARNGTTTDGASDKA
jgi:hypothetical protein